MGSEAPSRSGGWTARALNSPVVGMAPWIIFSVMVGPGRFELAVGLALVTTLLLRPGRGPRRTRPRPDRPAAGQHREQRP